MTARIFGKIFLYCAAVVIGLTLLAMLAVKVAIDRAPKYQDEIKAWVHDQVGYRVRFAHVWPALRWYGPELYFDRLELRSKDDQRVLARAAGGRIAADVWQLIRSGRLLAGRVELDSPDIVIARVGPERFALGSEIELRGENAAGPSPTLDDLPAGNLLIRGGRITVQHWNAALPRLVLDAVNLNLRRRRDAISLAMSARLPPVLGGTLRITGAVQGVGDIDTLTWQAASHARGISFRGWHELLPDYLSNLVGGTGAFDLAAGGHGRGASSASLNFSAAAVVTKLSDNSGATFDQISGGLTLDHAGDRWTLQGRDMRAVQSGRHDPVSQFDVRWRSSPAGLLELRARTSYLHADTLMPLTGLLPEANIREQLREIAPTGEWSDASLELSRGAVDGPWKLAVRAKFHDMGFAPPDRAPGLRGLTGSIAGTEIGGRIDLDARSVLVSWPRQWSQPAALDTLKGEILWRRSPDGLLIATPALAVANRDATLKAQAAWELSADADSPRLTFVADIDNGNAAAARNYLPHALLPPKTTAWLNRAFVAGHMPHAQVVFRGPVRHFPFRDGSGIFLARLRIQGLVLDYADGWPRIENIEAHAEFRNEGLTAELQSATAGKIAIDGGDARFADFKTGELEVHASVAGDAAGALDFLRATPLDAMAGQSFSGADARGPMRAHVELFFPFKQFDRRRVLVDGHLNGVSLNRRGSPIVATELVGDVDVEGAQVASADLRGRLLGGAFRMQARAPRSRPLTRTQLEFRGTLEGEALRAGFGLPPSVAVHGFTDWRAVLKMAPEPSRERSLRISSNLGGLEVKLPEPLAKAAGQMLPSWVELFWPSEAATQGRFTVGTVVRGAFELTADGGGWHLARGAVAFGSSEPAYSNTQILNIGGRITRLNLTDWQRFRPTDKNARPLSSYVHTARFEIGELDYLGLAFRDITLDLAGTDAQWQVGIVGPDVAGSIWMPAADSAAPWELEFERLKLADVLGPQSVADPAGTENPGAEASGAQTPRAQAPDVRTQPLLADLLADPRAVPAIKFHAENMSWNGRHFGTVQAAISKVDDGLTLDRLTAISPTFSVTATGEWRGKGAGLGKLEGNIASTDVETTMSQLGYADVISAKTGRLVFAFHWVGAPTPESLAESVGRVQMALDKGQVIGLKPGAGRVLGLSSVAALPRRLALDFSDLTDKGLAFDTIRGDFDLRDGSAYTDDVLLKGPAAEIGLIGRIGLKTKDYDQIAVVTGSLGNSLAGPLAGALAGGPVVAAAVLVFTQVFKQPLRGLARGYYRITGGWENPTVERIKSADVAAATAEVAK
jgi:uncharacterized protein (TIGR02099 family)